MIALNTFRYGPNKEAFHRYLRDFSAVEDEAKLLDSFHDCTDVLPAEYARLLFLPPGATYREAVQLLLASWDGPLRGPDGSTSY